MSMPRGVIESIFVLIIAYLLLTNSFGLTRILATGGQSSIGLIKALQGR